MKILFAIKTLVHSVGGAERLVTSLSNALAQTDMDVHLLTFDTPEAPVFYPVEGSVTRHYASTRNTAHKTRLIEYPALLWRLRRQIVALKPDVVVAFMHSMFVPVQCALIGTGIKVVLSEHTVPAYYKTRPFEMLALRFFALFAASATVVSSAIRALYPWPVRQKMVLLPNIVHSNFEKADFRSADKILLSVGRLNADKDHAILIEAFSLLAKEFPAWDLVIVGEGPERANLQAQIERLVLQDRVKLAGVCSDMNDVYMGANLFVMPSRYESFGLVTAEAMSHALPVIGFADCSGTNELIAHEENGLLVSVRSAQNLADAMRRLMADDSLGRAFGKAGYSYSGQYAEATVVNQWKRYISGVFSA